MEDTSILTDHYSNKKHKIIFKWPEDAKLNYKCTKDNSHRIEVSCLESFWTCKGKNAIEAEYMAFKEYKKYTSCNHPEFTNIKNDIRYTNGAEFCCKCGYMKCKK